MRTVESGGLHFTVDGPEEKIEKMIDQYRNDLNLAIDELSIVNIRISLLKVMIFDLKEVLKMVKEDSLEKKNDES